MTEYRAHVGLPDLPLSDEEAWEPLIAHLERVHGDLGPIIGWAGDSAEFVLSTGTERVDRCAPHVRRGHR
jgi:hypothetical protein